VTADARVTEKEAERLRDETLDLSKIDVEYLQAHIEELIRDFDETHVDYFRQRQDWLLALRDLRYQYREGAFENSSDLHVPYTLIMAKALHARIFQIFSHKNFFSVESNNPAFEEKEEIVSWFMNWVLSKWLNRGRGKSDVTDAWISDIVDEGSGIKKLRWDRWQHKFVDVEIETTEVEKPTIFTDGEEATTEPEIETKTKIKNVKKTKIHAAPAAEVVPIEDFICPVGATDVQMAPHIGHRVWLRDEELKLRVQQKRFDRDLVEEALERRHGFAQAQSNRVQDDTKRQMRRMEGVTESTVAFKDAARHQIVEFYLRAYVEKEVTDEDFTDVDVLPEEIVVWYHADLKKIIGWTYLHRISPSGKRPFYKSDFIPSKERAFGIGVGELLWSLNNHIDAVHNLKMDNGVLASLQFGVYRSGSTFKPDTFKIRPGDMIPVEDVNDFKFVQIPFLGQFGDNEELVLTGYGEKLLAVNDINLGNLTGKGVAGALRNATGASFVDRQANIQLHPHLDRIAREEKEFLSDLFILCRSRMDDQLFFRVTGEDGKGIFGEVSREELRGDYDFTVDVDLAAASDAEKQQRATLLLQTVLNPTLMQVGVVQPGNVYNAVKEYLIRQNVKNPDKYLTQPPGYTGPALTPEQRIFKILMGQFDDPPIEQTVKPEENHELALATYERFRDQPIFGVMKRDQLAALATLIGEHEKYMQLLSGGMKGMPNQSGTQMPMTGGLGGQAPAADEGSLGGTPEGEVNGPVF
jgi:hypothetical protein